ncbi:MAG: hypothetical protein QNK89_05425 [Lacinutrix sp.]|uniref:hypothetical protein n=1 Tax=Lacinutrix sp. TaxID=1937692 RepID=UPI0030B6D743
MLAHCCVAYEMVYTDKHPKPNALVRTMLKLFIKKAVVDLEYEYIFDSNNNPTQIDFT